MRRVICSCLGAMLIYFGVMTMPSFAGQSVDIADMENTGDVTVRYWGGGSRREPRVGHGREAKHGASGHSSSHHRRRHPVDKHRPRTSPEPPGAKKWRESPIYLDVAASFVTAIPHTPGLYPHAGESKHSRRVPSPSRSKPARPAREVVRDWSIDIATNIHLAKPVVDIQPQPEANKWNITAVGQPLWFHNSGASRHVASDSSHGAIVSLDAKRVETIYDTGEKTIRCTHSTPRPVNADPRAQSPDCGYAYQHPGSYTVRMTEVWRVGWRSGDQSGEIVTRRSSSKPLKVNELIGVLTKTGRR